jgi:hypothetical protein
LRETNLGGHDADSDAGFARALKRGLAKRGENAAELCRGPLSEKRVRGFPRDPNRGDRTRSGDPVERLREHNGTTNVICGELGILQAAQCSHRAIKFCALSGAKHQ